MNKDAINLIGSKESPRNNSFLVYLNQVDGLFEILDQDFLYWSDFDAWQNTQLHQWLFARAIEVYKGKKIDLCCSCCEYSYGIVNEYNYKLDQKCYSSKTAYLIKKIVEEIIIAKARRSNDGTYLT